MGHKLLISKYYTLRREILSIPFLIIFTLLLGPNAESRRCDVIKEISTCSEDNTSVILIELTGLPAYKVIPIGNKDMLIALKDTEVSREVYARETVVGDELVRNIEISQKPSRVTCVLVSTYKPYKEVRYEVIESNDTLRIEIRDKGKASEQNVQKAPPDASTIHPNVEKLDRFEAKHRSDMLLAEYISRDLPTADLFGKAIAYFKRGKWNEAISSLEKLIESHPDSRHLEKAYFLLAKSFHHKFGEEIEGHVVEITRHYQNAINRYPQSKYIPEATLSMANCYFEASRFHEAMVYYSQVLKEYESHAVAAKARFQRGKLFSAIGKPLMAMRDFGALEKRHVKTQLAMKAKIEIAKTLFEMKSFKESLKKLEEIKNARPDEIYKESDILLYTGHNYYELGRLKEARDVLSKALNYFPEMESIDVLLTRIADTYRETGATDKASKLYNYVAATYPDAEGAAISLLRLGAISEKAEREKKSDQGKEMVTAGTAQRIYEQIVEKFPDSSLSQLAMLKLGLLHQKNERYEESISTLKDTLEKYPATKLSGEVETALQESMFKLASQQEKKGDYAQSVNTLRELLIAYPEVGLTAKIKPVVQRSLKAVFEQKRREGNIEHIISYYERIKSDLPFASMPDILFLLGKFYKRLQLYGHAFSMFRKVRTSYTPHEQPTELLLGLGECAYREKELDEAEEALRTFVTKHPGHAEVARAYHWLGDILLKRQEYKKARMFLRLALNKASQESHRTKILMAMAHVSNSQGDYEEALKPLQEVITLLHQNKSGSLEDLRIAYRQLGETYFRLGEKEKAVPNFRKALELSPESMEAPSLQFRLAQCYQGVEARKKAEDMLNEIVASGDSFWSKVAQAQINEMNINESVNELGSGLDKS